MEPLIESSSTIRRAQENDAETLSELFHLTYGDSSHPCLDVEYVRRYVTNPRNICYVEVCNGDVVATMGMVYHQWNDTYEWSRGITLASHRRAAAETLSRKAHAEVCARQQGELSFGYTRARRLYDIGAHCLVPPYVATGHDGGMRIAKGMRETHIMLFARLPHRRFKHVAPPVLELFTTPLIREYIYQPLALTLVLGEYPPVCFVGPDGETHSETGFIYAFEPFASVLEINGYHCSHMQPELLCCELERLLQAFPTAQHISANLLADKGTHLSELRKLGFEVTAYLPAWYKCGGYRYDCLRIVKRNFVVEPIVHRLEEQIRFFHAEFAEL